MKMVEFTRLLQRHLIFTKSDFKLTKVIIEHALLSCGYTPKVTKMCSTCNGKYSRSGCGAHYEKTKKHDVKSIVGMRIINHKTDEPIWEESRVYHIGERVQYERKVYMATYDTKERPSDNAGSWERKYPTHVYGEVYEKDQHVSYKGRIWISQFDTNNKLPDGTLYAGRAAWKEMIPLPNRQQQKPKPVCREPTDDENMYADEMDVMLNL